MSFAELDPSLQPALSTRRSYLGWLMGLCVAGVGAALSVPIIRYSLYPLSAKTTETKWSDAGPASDFTSLSAPVQREITVEAIDGWTKTASNKVVYVTKNPAGQLELLSAVCPHLGCSVQWVDSQHKFACPCHGATYSPDGTKLGGPAPRGMDSLESRVQNGRLMVRYQSFRQLVPTKEVIG
ncbi:MAG: Rieske 2Fe-2S domain-containing protein [Acidobacteriaceae bacterium]|nr:Rieske 2Fe-2S domain-containing protein [Acidobacteriaceae bacterium]MBV8570789.1 Rieske 2Fe-2S domain-containing protein [Acidobacteriaceae bacterium]